MWKTTRMFSGRSAFLQSTATLGCAEGYEASGGFASFTCHLDVFFRTIHQEFQVPKMEESWRWNKAGLGGEFSLT